MARYRTIDQDTFANPKLRRVCLPARHLFVFLFSAYADDEGRFLVDTTDLNERAFTRADRLGERRISALIQELADANLLLLYGDPAEVKQRLSTSRAPVAHSTCGFLRGWYEHQHLPPQVREESTLPAPPVVVSSWAVADHAKAEYERATGKKARGTHWADAVAWFEANSQVQVDSELTPSQLGVDYPHLTSPHLTSYPLNPPRGGSVCVPDSDLPEADPDRPPPARILPPLEPRDCYGGDGPMLLQNNPDVRELIGRVCPTFTAPQVGRWAECVLQAVRDPNSPLSREQWLAVFEADPPTASRKPAQWVDFQERRALAVRGARERKAETDDEKPLGPAYLQDASGWLKEFFPETGPEDPEELARRERSNFFVDGTPAGAAWQEYVYGAIGTQANPAERAQERDQAAQLYADSGEMTWPP